MKVSRYLGSGRGCHPSGEYLLAALRRVGHVVVVALRHLVVLAAERPLARLPSLARRLGLADLLRLSRPQRLRAAFEELGGTFLKLGQMLALQPDVLSLAYCDALFDLMDRVPPFGFDQVENIVREELGRRPDELFDAFDRQPLATASIGQVHIASLGDRKLAVKVQRPTVEREFGGDLRLLRFGIQLIRLLHLRRLYWLVEPLSEFIGWTREELDYRNEARYMEQMCINASGRLAEQVPAVVAERSTRRVLSVEFLSGVTVLDYLRAVKHHDAVTLARVRADGFTPDLFIKNVVDNFLGDAFRHGMFHADLHPANLVIMPGSLVGYIDFGITGVLSTYARKHLLALTLAYTRGDLDGMCNAFFKVSSLGRGSDPGEFVLGLKRLATDWYEGSSEQRQLRKKFTMVMLDMLSLSRATGVLPERDVVKYIRSAIAIDGLIGRCAPGFNLGKYLEEVCERYLRLSARQMLFHRSRWVEWTEAGVRLLQDGTWRAAAALASIGDAGRLGDLDPRHGSRTPGGASSRRALRVAAVALGASVLVLERCRAR